MSHQPFRTPDGGNIDRGQPLTFTFDGKVYQGFAGDTLASALMANGVKLLARSFKYHRPRGLTGYGVEEANALVQLRTGARTEPNIPATRIELYDGLVAESQNRWPSLHFDIGAVNSKLSGLFPSGFYYKTFMWPAKLWPIYEHAIRHIAGMGKSATLKDPDSYAHTHRHCDVLIAGGGPAGLMAALSAGQSGARVILCDENASFGGMLRGRRDTVASKSGLDWVADTVAQLAAMENVRLLRRTTAAGYYDHNLIVLDERVADHKATPENHEPRHRIWHVRAKEVVLATGSIERPLVFADNDRPGVMLTSAAQAYANAHGALAGRRAVIFTNNASAYAAAADLKAAGIEVQAI
ncbi:MAG: 2Fe-2S iron-sulfur cluster-binding protein, partial [Rhodospirillales bacterium]|nr:2Fe-2S iron-sulfur cluster-binding protein [Rhodospirillales bacterium]